MKLLYIVNARIPTEKAHGIQIMKMCEAFALAGNEVELVVPRRLNPLKNNPFEYYNVKGNFKIKKLPCLDFVRFGKIGFFVQSLTFSISVFFYSIFKKCDFAYGRDELSLYFLTFLKNKKLFWETHTAKNNFVVKRALEKADGVISITQGLKDFYLNKYKIKEEKILVAPDGVDLKDFDIKLTKEELKEKLNLPKDRKIALYTGHLYDWKGAQVLADSSRFFKNDELLVFVGGTDKDIEEFKEKNKDKENILILGRVPHKKIPFYLKLADVLLLPNSAKSEISRLYTSPMKLFEYMASGVPIVASKLPSIEEVLINNINAILVESDNPKALFEGVNKILSDESFAEKISSSSFVDARKYLWKERSANILNFIKK